MAENLVTVREAASFLRISARTVYRLIEAGEIGAVRIGKQWRIPMSDLPGKDARLAGETRSSQETIRPFADA
jgi:excisionase family DNA binding protein